MKRLALLLAVVTLSVPLFADSAVDAEPSYPRTSSPAGGILLGGETEPCRCTSSTLVYETGKEPKILNTMTLMSSVDRAGSCSSLDKSTPITVGGKPAAVVLSCSEAY
jgi:hypothetical protein